MKNANWTRIGLIILVACATGCTVKPVVSQPNAEGVLRTTRGGSLGSGAEKATGATSEALARKPITAKLPANVASLNSGLTYSVYGLDGASIQGLPGGKVGADGQFSLSLPASPRVMVVEVTVPGRGGQPATTFRAIVGPDTTGVITLDAASTLVADTILQSAQSGAKSSGALASTLDLQKLTDTTNNLRTALVGQDVSIAGTTADVASRLQALAQQGTVGTTGNPSTVGGSPSNATTGDGTGTVSGSAGSLTGSNPIGTGGMTGAAGNVTGATSIGGGTGGTPTSSTGTNGTITNNTGTGGTTVDAAAGATASGSTSGAAGTGSVTPTSATTTAIVSSLQTAAQAVLSLTNQTTPPKVLERYPIGLSTGMLAGKHTGDILPDILNGSGQGSFGWMAWTSDVGWTALETSLARPGNSNSYINPHDSSDRVLNIGDWVYSVNGNTNAPDLQAAIEGLIDVDIEVPVWDTSDSTSLHVIGFVTMRITSYTHSAVTAVLLSEPPTPPLPDDAK